MSLKHEGQELWNAAYSRGGNILFYPHEEIIRFINKYVRKREGISEFRNVMPLSESEWKSFASLDLGCGIGRHVKYLDECGLNPYGVDLSDTAISMGKRWFESIGKPELSERLTVGSVTALPYEDNFFDICVSHGVLDSMPREIALKGLQEAYRVLKRNGLMYFDLIMDEARGSKDEVVDFGYEEGTIQSYFTIEGIKEFVGSRCEIIDFKIIVWNDDKWNEINRRAHIIIKKK